MAKEVRIHVTAVRREKPDLRKLARVLIQMVLAEQAESGDQPTTGVLPEEEEAS
jgi:hypothetical protein